MEPLKRILYVEDDPDIAMIAIMTLESIGGFEVLHCSDGLDALSKGPSFSPQLILLDVMIPKMDGPTLLAELKKVNEMQDLPVIFMTAKAQVHEQQAYLNMGAIGVIVKPFDPMKLSNTIIELWEKHSKN